MSTTPTPRRRTQWQRIAALLAVIVIPLAFAGLFIGAVSQVNGDSDRIPAAIVNNDELVRTTGPDGKEQIVLAGRLLVTQLTGADSAGFDWTITNSKDAREALKKGEVYAVITVPKDFSKSILSLSTDTPTQAKLAIQTDDAHNYLTGSLAETVGTSLSSAFGQKITEQVVAGIYSSYGDLGGAFDDAADGASKLADGASSLGSGLDDLAGGVASAQSGATKLSSGVKQYVGGVGSLASGLSTFQKKASALDAGDVGVTDFTGGVSQLSAALSGILDNPDLTDAQKVAAAQAVADNLSGVAANGPRVVGGVNTAFDSLAAGVGQSAAGAKKLASGGPALASGVSGLVSGLGELRTGASGAADGANEIASGAESLADGLSKGADQIPSVDTAQGEKAASIVANPVGVNVERNNEVSDFGQIIATLFVPLGLWIGSLALFLVLRPLTRRTLASTAGNGRLVLETLARASVLSVAQAALLVLLLHTAVGVSWAMLPATLAFALVMGLAFTAFHYLLTMAFGRGGLVVSILLLAVQITATGGLYPIELVAAPFQVVSPFLPLTYGVAGIQAIISGSGLGSAIGAAVALLAFGVGSVLLSLVAMRRVRRASALGMTPVTA